MDGAVVFAIVTVLVIWIGGTILAFMFPDFFQSWFGNQTEEDKQKRKEEIEKEKAEAEKRAQAIKESARVDRSSCLTCSKRGNCSGISCTGYSSDPNIKRRNKEN